MAATLLSFSLLIQSVFLTQLFNFNDLTNLIIYCIGQFFIGAFTYSLYTTLFVLVLEMTTTAYHTRMSIMLMVFYMFGQLIVMVVAYVSKNWKILQWFITGLCCLFTFVNIFFLSETPKVSEFLIDNFSITCFDTSKLLLLCLSGSLCKINTRR